jgi:uncharacterized membrane protein YcaP (DUF421 family)
VRLHPPALGIARVVQDELHADPQSIEYRKARQCTCGTSSRTTAVSTGTIIILSTIGIWVLALSYAGFRSRRANAVVEGVPVVVVRDGEILDAVLSTERVSRDELAGSARQQGIADLARVRCGILEPDGRFSFIVEEPPARRVQRDATADRRRAG